MKTVISVVLFALLNLFISPASNAEEISQASSLNGNIHLVNLMNFGMTYGDDAGFNQFIAYPRGAGLENLNVWAAPEEVTQSVPLIQRQFEPAGQITVFLVLKFDLETSDQELAQVECNFDAVLGSKTLKSDTNIPLSIYGTAWGWRWVSTPGGSVDFPLNLDELEPGLHDFELAINCGSNGEVSLETQVEVLRNYPESEFFSVTIDNGALASNSYEVNLGIEWPTYVLVDKVMVSNDGGFAKSRTKTFNLRDLSTLPSSLVWKVDSDSPVKTQRNVYVRYHIVGQGWRQESVSDDIFMDFTPPVIQQVTAAFSKVNGLNNYFNSNVKTAQLKILAKDNKSGVRNVRVLTGTGKTVFSGRYKKSITFKTSVKKLKIRVQDGAGNWSKPKSVTVSN